MKCKKLIALGLSAVTALSLSVPAFAENTIITGTYSEIKIDVTIPGTGEATINPYNMPVKAMYKPATGEAEAIGTLTTAGKIATQPLIGYSTCEVALDVGATVTGTAKGDLMLASKDITGVKTKSAVIYLECKQDNTLTVAEVSSDAADKPISGIKGTNAVSAFNAWPATTYSFADGADNGGKLLVGAVAKTGTKLCTLAAGADTVKADGTAGTDGVLDPQAGGFMLARLGGDVVQNPTTAWTARDGVVVNVAFTFTPAEPKEGGEISLSEDSIAANPTVTVLAPEGVTFSGNETYAWEIVTADGSGVGLLNGSSSTASILDSDGATTNLVAAKEFTVKCTVTDGGIKYVSTSEALQLTA